MNTNGQGDRWISLQDKRNEFVHFLPGGLSSEVSPRIVDHVADTIEHLADLHVHNERDKVSCRG